MPRLQRYAGFSSPMLNYASNMGFCRVLAFFVHTSLVLMYSLEPMHRESHALTLGFYIRRFLGLYPLSTFSIVLGRSEPMVAGGLELSLTFVLHTTCSRRAA